MKMIMLLMMAFDGASTTAPDVQLLDFSAGYCGPCQQMVPILQRMQRASFPVRQIDITEEPDLTRQFKVDRIPTLVLLVEGKEIQRFVGLTSEEELRRAMNKAATELSEKRLAAAPAPTVARPPASFENTDVAKSEERPPVARIDERRSLGEMFRKLIGKQAADDSLDRPTLRGQDPAAGGTTTANALDTAFASTVRVRVEGKSTQKNEYLQDVGTGTIVYSVTGQAIVLTCAHLFLNIAVKEAIVEVEVFENGKPVTYPAMLVGGDHDADLALLRIRTSKTFPSSRINARATDFSIGQPMLSFGCNDGADPTRLDMKLVAIDRYDGPPNLVCTNDPKSGRSGGGLFSAGGEIVGVCSCADRKEHEGLYAAHGAILELVNYCELKEILKTETAVGEDPTLEFQKQLAGPDPSKLKAATEGVRVAEAASAGVGAISPSKTPPADTEKLGRFTGESPDEFIEVPEATVDATPTAPPVTAPLVKPSDAAIQSGPEITIVIDDKTPGSKKKVIVIPQASAWMLEMLTGEATVDSQTPVTTALRPSMSRR